jgi:ribosomal protein S18 acetylase RimI-like enzyme
MLEIRPGEPRDLAEIAAIQTASPAAAAWPAADYLQYDLRVAVRENRVAAFLAARTVAEGESEILDLAVAPEFRRRGFGRALMESFLKGVRGAVFLEVHKSLGFQELALRQDYYAAPPEAAIVMKFHSC